MHFRLFNKPAAFGIKSGLGNMWIDGLYDDYTPGEPYEGRVQIHGSVGLMKLEIIDSNIPPGSSVYIDQLTKEVVVKWAIYTPPTAVKRGVPNGDFENNDYWEVVGADTPARIETGWSPNNKGNLTYRDHKGEYIVRGAWAPAGGVNQKLTITGKVEHGKSSKGNASCAIGLAWYNANRELVREDFGNAVTNGGKGRWYDTKLDGFSSNRDIKFVRPAIKFTRKKQNHPIHIGQIEWDHVYEEGYDSDETLFVHVRVTDSVHNVAEHRGTIDEVSLWYTSKLYPIFAEESFSGAYVSDVSMLRRGYGVPDQLDTYCTLAPVPLSLVRRRTMQQINGGIEQFAVLPAAPLRLQRKRTMQQINAGIEQFAVGRSAPTKIVRKVHPYIQGVEEFQINPPKPLTITRGK